VDTLSEKEHNPHGPFAALRRAVPTWEVIRFLIVGGFNTLFSMLLYFGFGILLTRVMPGFSQVWIADLALVCSTPIAITISFLGFKHFVFRTKGHYLREWIRTFAVYSVTIPVSLVLVALFTELFLLTSVPHKDAKFLAGIANSAIIAVYSYFGHKKFSFKR
jgi:putative flippase GtrA